MPWLIAMAVHVLLGSLLALWVRHVSSVNKNAFFSMAFFNYLVVLIGGTALAMYFNNWSIPSIPTGRAVIYLLVEGILLPMAWVLNYKLISMVGAANSVIAGTAGIIATTVLGIIFLHEPASVKYFAGACLMVFAIYISFSINADEKHKQVGSIWLKTSLIFGVATLTALGLIFEKKAISSIGYSSYYCYGWGMQCLGAFVIMLALGRDELRSISVKTAKYGLSIGLLTVITGSLFVYALSKGALSSAILFTSSKISITVVLAAILLKERNDFAKRILALLLSLAGLVLIL